MVDSIEARFTSFSKGKLAMDDKDVEEAMKVFDKSKHLFLTNASPLGSGRIRKRITTSSFFLLFCFKRLSQNDVICDKVFGRWEWDSNAKFSPSGFKIMIGWDQNYVRVMVIHSSNQSMFCLIEDVSTTFKVSCTFVNANNDGKERRELWKDLENQYLFANGDPWCIMGDFNVTLKLDEHSEGMSCSSADMSEFQECIGRLEMEDINKTVSDHSPAVMIMPKSLNKRNRAFRFSNYLSDKKQFIPAVKKGWDKRIKGFKMYVLIQQLKSLKKVLKSMSWKKGNLTERVVALKEELKLIQIKSIENVQDVDIRKIATDKLREYNEAVNDEVKLLYELAKHKSIIGNICDENGIRYSGGEVPKKFVTHFKNFLGVSREIESITNAQELFTQKVINNEGIDLCKDVTTQEIDKALKSIDDNKAPEDQETLEGKRHQGIPTGNGRSLGGRMLFQKRKRVLTDKDQEAVKECYKEGTAGKERPQADARIDAEVEEMLDGTPRKKSRTARDDVKMEGNKNKRRNSRNFCGGTTQREETRLIMLLVNNESILVNLVLVDCAKTCACNDFTVVSEPKKGKDTKEYLLGTEEVSVEECCFKKGKRVLTDKDQEAVKEVYKEYIGMVKIYYEEAKRSRHGEPEDVAVNCRGTAGKERPQADARIDAEVEEMLDGTPRKKGLQEMMSKWKAIRTREEILGISVEERHKGKKHACGIRAKGSKPGKNKSRAKDKDQEAVKECYKEYIGMVKIYYEEAKRSRHGEPGDVAVNCRGTAGKERPQADARIDAEVEEMLDETPRKRSKTEKEDVNMEDVNSGGNYEATIHEKEAGTSSSDDFIIIT
ncbi:RNA-directed DNA polymerase, eukaryota, reverse transcriptase zinc-binding domain protein [Tanacetum coccineum]